MFDKLKSKLQSKKALRSAYPAELTAEMEMMETTTAGMERVVKAAKEWSGRAGSGRGDWAMEALGSSIGSLGGIVTEKKAASAYMAAAAAAKEEGLADRHFAEELDKGLITTFGTYVRGPGHDFADLRKNLLRKRADLNSATDRAREKPLPENTAREEAAETEHEAALAAVKAALAAAVTVRAGLHHQSLKAALQHQRAHAQAVVKLVDKHSPNFKA